MGYLSTGDSRNRRRACCDDLKRHVNDRERERETLSNRKSNAQKVGQGNRKCGVVTRHACSTSVRKEERLGQTGRKDGG